jgi:hypothetical protein
MNPLDFILHINEHLAMMVETYGVWVYAILFLIVFAETGLVVTPFLPGDSLLFAVGAIAASTGKLDPFLCGGIVMMAAFCGDNVNYWVGRTIGKKYSLGRIPFSSAKRISKKPSSSIINTVRAQSSWRVLSPSCAPSRPLWQASEKCHIFASSLSVLLVRHCGRLFALVLVSISVKWK